MVLVQLETPIGAALGTIARANEASVRRAEPDPEASPAQRDARRSVQRRLISS